MGFTKERFGKELKEKIESGSSPQEIGKWAFEVFFHYGRSFDPNMNEVIQKVFMMEEGPEFEYSRDELLEIAEKFIAGLDPKL